MTERLTDLVLAGSVGMNVAMAGVTLADGAWGAVPFFLAAAALGLWWLAFPTDEARDGS